MNEEQIKHLARLAEIHLSDEELSKMKKEFDVILEFVWRLQQVDTEGVEMMYTPIDSLELDYTRKTNTSVDKKLLLENSPHEVVDNMIVIKSSTVEH